jgi:hypothetical protein
MRENILRGSGTAAINARKTHCDSGHEFTPENTAARSDGGRDCRKCIRIHAAKQYRSDSRKVYVAAWKAENRDKLADQAKARAAKLGKRTSPYKWVYPHPRALTWYYRIQQDGKRTNVYGFRTAEEARNARQAALDEAA